MSTGQWSIHIIINNVESVSSCFTCLNNILNTMVPKLRILMMNNIYLNSQKIKLKYRTIYEHILWNFHVYFSVTKL